MYSVLTPASGAIVWPFIIVILLTFLIWTEDESQNLYNLRCHHRAPTILVMDGDRKIIDKTLIAVQNQSNVVGWRRSLIASLLVTIFLLFIFLTVFPTGFTILLVTCMFFVTFYFSSIWIMSRGYTPNNEIIKAELLALRSKIN